jgi:hypothetical protein
MTTLSLRLAFALSIAASSLARDVPAGAQLAGGHSAFNARPGFEFESPRFRALVRQNHNWMVQTRRIDANLVVASVRTIFSDAGRRGSTKAIEGVISDMAFELQSERAPQAIMTKSGQRERVIEGCKCGTRNTD